MFQDSGTVNLAEEYHVASRNVSAFKAFSKLQQAYLNPFLFQAMADAPLHIPASVRVELPKGTDGPSVSLERAILTRRSSREFSPVPVSLEHLARVLYLANGVRGVVEMEGMRYYQRNAPNAGNLGSVEIFPIILNVEGVEPGIYHFDTLRMDLAQLHGGQFEVWLKEKVLIQSAFARAGAVLVLGAAVGRLTAKYGLRGYRLALMDVGHVSENIHLVGAGLDLAVCATAGFMDDELDRALRLDGLEMCSMLAIAVGCR
jgi:SagB-type dehydrogenase family enzyme